VTDQLERKQLEELRAFPGWPRRLDRLAVRAAAIGRLHESVESAEVGLDRFVSSVLKVLPVTPRRDPDREPGFSLPAHETSFYFYTLLEQELRQVLGPSMWSRVAMWFRRQR